MKLRTCILAAGAILALAAPAGYAATGSIPGDSQSGYGHPTTMTTPAQKLVKAVLKNKHQVSTIQALRAKNKALAASNKMLGAANDSLSVRIRTLTDPAPALGSVPQYAVLACVTLADPVQTIDYPASYDWTC